MNTKTENPHRIPDLVLWELPTDRTDRQYTNVRPQLIEWLTDTGIPADNVTERCTIRIVLSDEQVWVSTWQTNRDLAGNTEPCPSCEHCVRGHQDYTLLTALLPPAVAALGWPDPAAPADWLSAVNERATEQANTARESR